MRIFFNTIPHRRQRYDTVGDYVTRNGVTTFYISRMKDKRHVWLVFLHEVIEWGICRVTGVKSKEIDKYDIAYEKGRQRKDTVTPCGCAYRDEPGDDIHAPYHQSHQVASECERIIGRALGVDWLAYEEEVMRL